MYKVPPVKPAIKKIEIMIKVPDKAKSCDECFEKWLAKIEKAGNPIARIDYDNKEVFAYMEEF